MHDFNRCNKVTGVHYFKKSVNDLRIKVVLKLQDSIIALPKFEDFTNDSKDINIDEFENKHEEYTFNWQKKYFSSQELQYYKDEHNCLADYELHYHSLIKNNDVESNKVFTYINDDNYKPIPFEEVNRNDDKNSMLTLWLDKLNINENVGKLIDTNTESMRHLFKSEENVNVDGNSWISMHIMFDNSKYNDDFQLMIKQEAILLSLYWNPLTHCLVLKPDVNNIDWNPYSVESISGVRWNYQYAVELIFDDEQPEDADEEEFKVMLRTLQKTWDKRNRHLLQFVMPPVGEKLHYVTIEILTAKDFDMDNLYIDYNIKIPDNVKCDNSLHGRTHTSKHIKTEDGGTVWNFGHLLELEVACDVASETPILEVFLEAISQDWWGRHRTEGYSHMRVPLDPGLGSRVLSSMRPEEKDRIQAESRRFFLGGCHLLKDLDVLIKPQEFMNPNFVYVSTGSISVRWHTVCQSPTLASVGHRPRGYSSSALLLGADAVLRQYKRARARLAAATKDLDIDEDDSEDICHDDEN